MKVQWANVGVRFVSNFFRDQWARDGKRVPKCRVTNETKQVSGEKNRVILRTFFCKLFRLFQGDKFDGCVSGVRRVDFGFPYDYESIMHYSRVS